MQSPGSSTQQTTADTESLVKMMEISAGYWLSRALQVVADLGVADAIGQFPRSAADLAATVRADTGALNRVLRLLASEGIFERQNDTYSHNQLSRLLRSDHPHSMRAYVRLLGIPLIWDSWGSLGEAVRTGHPVAKDVFGYFKEHPAETEIFNAGMRSKAQTAIEPVISAYDFTPFKTIGDIGGGLGHLLKAILKLSPGSRGVLFDQPQVVEVVATEPDFQGRLMLQGGDFFTGPIPRCDAYILMEVLHDWPDEPSRQILRNIREAALDGAKLVIIETVLPEESAWAAGKGQHFGHHLDINMLILTGGRERTPEEFAALFTDTGWQFARVVPTAGPYSIVEAE